MAVADAVQVVRTLLAAHAPLLAVVPGARIFAGVIPQGTAAPAIAVTHVSTGRPQMVGAASGLAVSRVQVTVMAASYDSQKAVLALVRAALPRSRGSVNGVAVDNPKSVVEMHEGDTLELGLPGGGGYGQARI